MGSLVLSGMRERAQLWNQAVSFTRVGVHAPFCVFPYPFSSLFGQLLKEQKETRKQRIFVSDYMPFSGACFYPRHYRVSISRRKQALRFLVPMETTGDTSYHSFRAAADVAALRAIRRATDRSVLVAGELFPAADLH